MFNFDNQLFGKAISVPKDAQVVFVADMFTDDYVGGAELTTEALIESTKFKVSKLHARDVSAKLIVENSDKFWIFGNFSQLDYKHIPAIVSSLSYAILEYDYKYCSYRSPEKHTEAEHKQCDCENRDSGKIVSAFYHGAKHLWWMSEAQMNRYHELFPFLRENNNTVLSSVFSKKTLDYLAQIKTPLKSSSWIVLGSNSWVKGFDAALQWCKETNKSYEVVWNVQYEQLLKKLSVSEGFVYLPVGGDTCPRMTIEAKLLGCKLQINDNVQHKNETWFNTDDLNSITNYLESAPEKFWKGIEDAMYRKPTISGYVTTYNCISQTYPYEKCIRSLLNFCTEVCVVDGGSTDGTWETLTKLSSDDKRIVVKQIVRDWKSPGFSVFDGMQKAEARAMCTKDFCWQADCDEIFHQDDSQKIIDLCKLSHADIIALPVVEWWGSFDKVRIDVTPWKWRMSRNKYYITHGIPKELRGFDSEGKLFSHPGSDGCDYIHKDSFERIPFVSFYTQEADVLRRQALGGDSNALVQYEQWFNTMVNALPASYHYSWLDIKRKLILYRDYWSAHWNDIQNRDASDLPQNNMFFDCKWSDVTDEMIDKKVEDLKKTGGHIFHTKYQGAITPWIKCHKSQPDF